MIKKLRRKFTVINMVLAAVMLVAIFSLVLAFTARSLEQQSMQTLQAAANTPMGVPVQIREPWFCVEIGPAGWQAVGSGYFDLEDGEFLQRVLSEATGSGGVLESYGLRYLRTQSPKGEKLVFLDITAQKQTMAALWQVSIAIFVLAMGLFWVISLFLARWAVKPVERAWDQQKQFVADASHELKTPLTVIATNAELLTQDCPEEEKAQFLQSIQIMTRQMRGLVEDLLDLARADNGTGKMEFALLDLSCLVAEGLLPFEPVYFEAGLALESRLAENVAVRGSQAHLHQLLDILLDNACKYTAPGTPVRVSLSQQGRWVLLTVANMGKPLSKQEQKDIFKRFYRGDAARTRNGSYGLGLSIAQTITAQHGGHIRADSQNGWNIFTVQLPIG